MSETHAGDGKTRASGGAATGEPETGPARPRRSPSERQSRHRRRLSASELELPERVGCPFCEEADETELHSAFGSALSVATYWCNRCRTAFEWIKWDER